MHFADGGLTMEQKIRIRIAGREYDLKSNSPEQEGQIRKSADMLNRMIDSYQSKYPQKDIVDILSFVALNQGISNLSLIQKLRDVEEESRDLQKGIEGYLDDILTVSR